MSTSISVHPVALIQRIVNEVPAGTAIDGGSKERSEQRGGKSEGPRRGARQGPPPALGALRA